MTYPVASRSDAVLVASLSSYVPYVRARWSDLLTDKAKLRTAFALESALEQICAVAGPPPAAFLAVQVSPVAGLAVAIAACLNVTIVAFASEQDARGASGLLLAGSSIFASLAVGLGCLGDDRRGRRGNSPSGVLIDRSGAGAGFVVSLVASVLAALLVQAMRVTDRGVPEPGG